MNELYDSLMALQDAKTIIILVCACMGFDILTGYLKAFKNKSVNSSISRDGFIKKLAWVIAVCIGLGLEILLGTKVVLIGTAIICVCTEAISVYENLSELGVKLPFAKYFEKVLDDKKSDFSDEE